MQYTKADIRKVGSFEETTSGLWVGAYRDIFAGRLFFQFSL